MERVARKVLAFVREHTLFTPDDRVLVAVSGGADSVALLHILANLAEYRLRPIVAHLNHCLRGVESDGDQRFVEGLAERHGIVCEVGSCDVRELSRRERLSLEDAGRKARYAFFESVAERYGVRTVALAHHADDQAETVLMRLIRGAGAAGLAAMAPIRGERFVRPLLKLTRREIESYLTFHGISWRTDHSNLDTAFLRNRIRHELLPILSHYNPDIASRLTVTAELLAADEEFLAEAAAAAFDGLVEEAGNRRVALDVSGILAHGKAVRYRLYRRATAHVSGDLAGLAAVHVCKIDEILRSSRPNLTVRIPGDVTVVKSYSRVTFSSHFNADNGDFELFVEGPGCYLLPGGGELIVEAGPPPVDCKMSVPSRAVFDLGSAPFPWLIRNFRAGDRIRPFGMTGSKKVKDLFIDEKVPFELRRSIPLVFSNAQLIWVCGLRTADAVRVSYATSTAVTAEIRGRRLKGP